MANVLMVAVLVAVSVGVYLLLGHFEDAAPSPDRRDGAFLVDRGPGERQFLLQYVRGEAIPLDAGVLQVTVDGVYTEHPLTAVADQTADGTRWVVGETLCIVGDAACLHPDATEVEVYLFVDDEAMFHAERTLRP